MAELVDRPDCAQDIAFTGIFEEPHEADRGVPAHGKLSERERSPPGLGVHEPDREPEPEPAAEPDREPASSPPMSPPTSPLTSPSPAASPTTSPKT